MGDAKKLEAGVWVEIVSWAGDVVVHCIHVGWREEHEIVKMERGLLDKLDASKFFARRILVIDPET
jgi:hypothetical protein